MWLCWEHPTRSQLHCCFVSASKYHKVPVSCQIPSPCNTWMYFQASWLARFQEHPLGLFHVETICSRSAGKRVEIVSLCKESRVISTAGWFLSKGRQMWLYPIWNQGEKGQDLFDMTERSWLTRHRVANTPFPKAGTERCSVPLGALKRYWKVVPGHCDPDGPTTSALCFPFCNTPSSSLSRWSRVQSYQHGHSRLVLQGSHQSDIHQLSNLVVTQSPLQARAEAAPALSGRGLQVKLIPGPAFHQLLIDWPCSWHSQGLAALHARVKGKL